MNKKILNSLLKKDIKTFLLSKTVLPVFIVGIGMFFILYPAIFASIIRFGSEEDIKELVGGMGLITEGSDRKILFSHAFTFLAILAMILPLLLGNILGIMSIAAEKDSKTLETILYSPITTKPFIITKIKAIFIPGICIYFGGLLLTFGIVSAFSLTGGYGFPIPPVNTIIMYLAFGPISMVFISCLTIKDSIKAESSVQAQQKSVKIILPALLIIMLIASLNIGLTLSNSTLAAVIFISVVSLLLGFITYMQYNSILKKFDAEKILG